MVNLQETQQCVKCGLCLPHCPTFTLTGLEAESPRGRIALIQTLTNPEAEHSAGLIRHLDSCLMCRACEAMCPSRVAFGSLMDNARGILEKKRTYSFTGKLMRRLGLGLVSAGPHRLHILALFARLYRNTGLQSLLRKSRLLGGSLQQLDRMLVRTPRVFKSRAMAPLLDKPVGTVQLFRGCVTSFMDSETLEAAQTLLNRLGYRVGMPQKQGCCGALHQHNGDLSTAQQLAKVNLDAFTTSGTDPIVAVASGCAAQLKDYAGLYPETIPPGFTDRVTDIHRLLLDSENIHQLQFNALHATAALHIPCTQRNALRETSAIAELLGLVPGLQIQTLNPQGGCCGAAGSYFLTQADIAGQLGNVLLEKLAGEPPDYLLSSNIGCALHLAAGIQARGWKTEVLHPVSLLARQLGNCATDALN